MGYGAWSKRQQAEAFSSVVRCPLLQGMAQSEKLDFEFTLCPMLYANLLTPET